MFEAILKYKSLLGSGNIVQRISNASIICIRVYIVYLGIYVCTFLSFKYLNTQNLMNIFFLNYYLFPLKLQFGRFDKTLKVM